MAEPDWAVILEFLYRNTGEFSVEVELVPDDITDDIRGWERQQEELHHQLSQKTDIHEEDIGDVLENLDRVNLVDRDYDPDAGLVSLTERGFDVAHERELNERQQSMNRILAILTAGLVFGAVAQGIGAYYSTPMAERMTMGLIMIFVGAMIITVILALLWGR